MSYHVSRNGQLYGPYTLEDLRRYVASGNILPSDLARRDDLTEWLLVAQVLGDQTPGIQTDPASAASALHPAYAPTAYAAPAVGLYPDAPNLQWGLLLLIDILTCGFFQVIWNLVLAAWARRIAPPSKALIYYIAAMVLTFANFGSSFGNILGAMHHQPVHPNYIGVVIGIATWVVRLIARFTLRDTLELHYNGPEPIGLRLNGVLTFFFGGIYFQYKLNEINQMKQGMRYRNLAP